jgi:hypothetical protein
MRIPVRPREYGLLGPLVAASIVLAACDARVRLVEPRASAAPPAVLTLAASDTALARRAGWSPGVPGTGVYIRRDKDPSVATFTADEHGVAPLSDLPAADYWVWAEKRPAGAELEAPVSAPAALGAGGQLTLQSGSYDTLLLRGQVNGALVISEFHYVWPPPAVVPPDGDYVYDWYIELYNNADSTIYLDGKIVGAGFDYTVDSDLWPCTETEAFRNDPRGIWSQRFQAFPGSGHDHPLAPGQAVVIAEQAIDHSAVYPGLPDLRNADFQFSWSSRAMNPAVPSMVPIQITTWPRVTIFRNYGAAFVAAPLEVASLERKTSRWQGDFVLFPRETLLDLAQIYDEERVTRGVAPFCRAFVHPSLDALAAFASPDWTKRGNGTHLLSAQRKVLPDGHLQRTGTSAVDWEIRARSPGKVP